MLKLKEAKTVCLVCVDIIAVMEKSNLEHLYTYKQTDEDIRTSRLGHNVLGSSAGFDIRN